MMVKCGDFQPEAVGKKIVRSCVRAGPCPDQGFIAFSGIWPSHWRPSLRLRLRYVPDEGRSMMTASRSNFWRATLIVAGMAVSTTGAIIKTQAQAPSSNDFFPPASKDFFGLDQNRSAPLEIKAELAEPEVNGVERYGGNGSWVLVRLGSTALESHFVTVYYERSPATAGVATADLRKAGLAHILKLEASGDVVLAYQDQTAAGGKLVFGIRVNRVWFAGNVVLTQKQNVIKVGRLFANLTTGYIDETTLAPWEVLGLNRHRRPTSEKWIYDVWAAPKPKDAR